MAPVNANELHSDKAFVPAKKALPEVETENGNGHIGYVQTKILFYLVSISTTKKVNIKQKHKNI